MNTIRRIAKNTLVLTASDIANRVLSFIFVIQIARYLGDIGFGKYSFAFAFVNLFIIFADFGLNTILIREIAKHKLEAKKFLGNALIIKLFLCSITFLLIFITINLMDYPTDTTIVVYLVGITLILGSLSGIFGTVFRAFEKMEYVALISTIERLFVVSIGIIVLKMGFGVVSLAMVLLAGNIISFILSIVISFKKFVIPEFEIDLVFWRYLLKESFPFIITGLSASIYFYIDSVMLSFMKGEAVVGLYNAAYNLVLSLMFIPSAFMGAVFPVLSQFSISSHSSIKLAYEKSFKWLFTLSLPIVVGTALISENIILFIYKIEFVGSALALKILIFVFIFMCFNIVIANVMYSIGKQTVVMKAGIMGVIFNVTLNALLIPKLSLNGASIATVLTETLVFLILFYYISVYFHKLMIIEIIYRPIIAVFMMSIFILFFRHINIFLIIILSVIIYFATLYLIKGITEEDIKLIKKSL